MSIRFAETIDTVKYSALKGEFPYKSVQDAPSTNRLFAYQEGLWNCVIFSRKGERESEGVTANKKCNISGSIRRAETIETVNVSVLMSIRHKAAYDGPSIKINLRATTLRTSYSIFI